MPDTPQSLADRLREEGGRVVHFFNHLNFDQWGILIYPQESNWSFHQLLAHFVSAEISRKELITHICDGGKRAPIDFEIDTFNQREVERLSAESNDNLLQLLTQERANIIEVMSAIFSQDLKRVGNDPYLGQVTLLEMIKLTYRHLQIHLRETRQFI
jgi:hypothetical protein